MNTVCEPSRGRFTRVRITPSAMAGAKLSGISPKYGNSQHKCDEARRERRFLTCTEPIRRQHIRSNRVQTADARARWRSLRLPVYASVLTIWRRQHETYPRVRACFLRIRRHEFRAEEKSGNDGD